MVSLVCQELFFGIFSHPSRSHCFPHLLNTLYHETAGIAIPKMEIFMRKKKKNNSENFDFYSSHQIYHILGWNLLEIPRNFLEMAETQLAKLTAHTKFGNNWKWNLLEIPGRKWKIRIV